jgi:hypothetical protein
MDVSRHKPTLARSATYKRENAALPPPDIKVAFHDEDTPGLIPVSVLDTPLTVDLLVWDAAKPGYTYRLYWDGAVKGDEKTILETDKPGDPLTLEISTDLMTEGNHTVAYQIYSPFSNVYEQSDIFPIIIDRVAPGKPELSAIQFPPEVSDGLTLTELVQLGDKLTVEIAGYTGMAKHDVIHTFWGEKAGPTATVTENDMGLDKTMLDFSRSFLESIDREPHSVKYHVVDRAGNVSADSISVEISLLLQEIAQDYPAPILDPAVGNLIDYIEAKPGVEVNIPRYPDPLAGDEITFYWGEYPMQPVKLPPGNENDDIVLVLAIPYDTISTTPNEITRL